MTAVPILRMSCVSPQWRVVPDNIGVADGDANSLDDALQVFHLPGSEHGSARRLSQGLQIVGTTKFSWANMILTVGASYQILRGENLITARGTAFRLRFFLRRGEKGKINGWFRP